MKFIEFSEDIISMGGEEENFSDDELLNVDELLEIFNFCILKWDLFFEWLYVWRVK